MEELVQRSSSTGWRWLIIKIGNREVGIGYKPIISAELSISHQADINIALEMIDKAAGAGASAVKVQYYRTEDFCTDEAKTVTYKQVCKQLIDGTYSYEPITELEYDLFKRHEIDLEFVKVCRARAIELGLIFGVTTTSSQGVVEVAGLTDYFKIASDMVVNSEMIAEMKRHRGRGKPIILSTGHVPVGEVADWEGHNVMFLHCVSEYPAQNPQLWKFQQMLKIANTEVGYSDHTIGIESAIRATELGAFWIECHVTLDRRMPGPDHWWSKSFEELKALCEAVG